MSESGHSYEGCHTARGLDEYCLLLGFVPESGLRILDVGASAGTFAKEMAERFGDRVVVDSLDLFGGEDVTEGRIIFTGSDDQAVEYYPHRRIVGDMTQKQFKLPPESYDLVVSLYAIPTWVDDLNSTITALIKMAETLKVGGEIRLFPVWINNLGYLSGFGHPDNFLQVKKIFERYGYSFSLEPVVDEKGALVEEKARRLVIKKSSREVPPAEELMKTSLLRRLLLLLKEELQKEGNFLL